MKEKTIRREDRENFYASLTVEQKLDLAEEESRSLIELNPDYALRRFIESFRRKRRSDAQRSAEAAK